MSRITVEINGRTIAIPEADYRLYLNVANGNSKDKPATPTQIRILKGRQKYFNIKVNNIDNLTRLEACEKILLIDYAAYKGEIKPRRQRPEF